MIRPLPSIGLLLASCSLVGCGLFGPAAPPARDPLQAAGVPPADVQFCARQAEDSPAVKLLINKGLGNEVFFAEHQDELRARKQDATVACLRGRGAVRGGGVERQKPL